MQTFLAYPSYFNSAKCLDNKRLGKQRVEVLQILSTLAKGPYQDNGKLTPWYNHPAVKMWKNYEHSLIDYGMTICEEWIDRGFKDSCYCKIINFRNKFKGLYNNEPIIWLTPEFCLSHQSNLLRKLPSHYRPIFGPDVPDNLPYVWPVK